VFVECSHIVGQVCLAHDCPALRRELFSGVLFLPIRWQSKNCLEQVSPYLNQDEAENCWFRATWSCKASAMWP
jgi:hypothetical protein